MRTLKNKGRGRYDVLDDAGRVVKGGADLERSAAVEVINTPPPAKTRAEQIAEDRAYQRQLDADLAKPLREEMDEIRKVLAKRRDADEVRMLAGVIEPILKSGKQALRRERRSRMIILPAKPVAAAAA